MRSRLHEMCEFVVLDAADYRERPDNASVEDLTAMWKMRNKHAAAVAARRPPGPRAASRREGRPEVVRRASSWQLRDLLGLYVHIPFCSAICNYCNFNRGLFDAAQKARYVDALVDEIERAPDVAQTFSDLPESAADTIYFGGGTPSLLEPAEVARIIDACREAFDVTPTPRSRSKPIPKRSIEPRLAAFRAAGVNRLSFGVQSFRDDELRRLSRLHGAGRARAGAGRGARAPGSTTSAST